MRPGHTHICVDTDVTVVLELPAETDCVPADTALVSGVATQLIDGFGITQGNEVEQVDPVGESSGG